MHKILFYIKFIICLYMFRPLLCSSSGGQNCIIQHLVSSHSVGGRPVLSQPLHRTATYRCDDTRCCIIKFWPPDDKHNSARNMYRNIKQCDDTRCCIIQFWSPDDEHNSARNMYRNIKVWWYQMLYNTILTPWWWAQQCSKHVQEYKRVWWYQMLYNKILTPWRWAQQCSKHVQEYKRVWWHQMLYNTILTSWWWAHNARNM